MSAIMQPKNTQPIIKLSTNSSKRLPIRRLRLPHARRGLPRWESEASKNRLCGYRVAGEASPSAESPRSGVLFPTYLHNSEKG